MYYNWCRLIHKILARGRRWNYYYVVVVGVVWPCVISRKVNIFIVFYWIFLFGRFRKDDSSSSSICQYLKYYKPRSSIFQQSWLLDQNVSSWGVYKLVRSPLWMLQLLSLALLFSRVKKSRHTNSNGCVVFILNNGSLCTYWVHIQASITSLYPIFYICCYSWPKNLSLINAMKIYLLFLK